MTYPAPPVAARRRAATWRWISVNTCLELASSASQSRRGRQAVWRPCGVTAITQHPFGVGVCRHHQLHSAFAPAGLFSCPIGHQGSLPALRRSDCPGSVALAAAPSAVNTKLQWKSRLQPHAGSELQRPSPLHMHQKTCPEPLRGPPAATRRQRRRASASPAAARASSQPLLLLTAWGIWRRLRRGWVVKVPEVECPRGARWNGGSVRSAEANQRPDRKSSGSFVRCAAIGTRQAKKTARWWHRAGSEEGDGGGL